MGAGLVFEDVVIELVEGVLVEALGAAAGLAATGCLVVVLAFLVLVG